MKEKKEFGIFGLKLKIEIGAIYSFTDTSHLLTFSMIDIYCRRSALNSVKSIFLNTWKCQNDMLNLESKTLLRGENRPPP